MSPSRLRRSGERGASFIEMLAAVGILAVLATAVIPLAVWDQKRRDEARLRISLRMMRDAIDKYNEYVVQGLIIQEDVEQMGYPLELQDLVEGVEVSEPESPDVKTIKFLQRIPFDPMLESDSDEPEWGLRSYQDEWDSDNWGRENVYDVYSLSGLRALDGTYYADW